MSLDFSLARPLLKNADLSKLFIDQLGWEPCRHSITLQVDKRDFTLTALAEKRGFIAWRCDSPDGCLPDHKTRLRLDCILTQTNFEHLIVFIAKDRVRQSWMWVLREPGKPLSIRTHEFTQSQPGDSLLQKLQLLRVSLQEEEIGLSVTQVAGRVRAAFDIEKITKLFYRDFDTQRKGFLKFIEGIKEVADREWYASVMLNRLMFVYFIQRKGFLDGDSNYLRNRLRRCQQENGKDKFYSFYRYFLLRLFHEGFGKRRKDRTPDLEKLLGNIPYLNGGLFDVHELEKPDRYGDDIKIPDGAFERIFDYFDQYQWHLDERPLHADNEINPDVLGYIFEKYINQKQMGAYYTKEDITEYISKNTVLPFLFDAARTKCKIAFENSNGPTVWQLLSENPDRYIYDAIKKGVGIPLPKEIADGLDSAKPNLIQRRIAWNKPAPDEYALPTEIWREVVARRQRYDELKKILTAGNVRDINDLITLNLDIRQFAQDTIQTSEGPDLLMAFWQGISSITVLDPTGGSGAFIFAALNILDPLYEACLDRMEAFLTEWGENGHKIHPNYYKNFTEVLDRVDKHPNRRYFVLKSIILNNLYAVDIMEEAVEICKLRLFLKLAAQVEPDTNLDNLGIEPLPDIDFNIRAGNALVGYATYDEVKRAVVSTLDFDNAMEKISIKAADLQKAFEKFRQLQTEGESPLTAAEKQDLQKRLKAVEDELNHHLAAQYGVKTNDKVAYAKWVKTHLPFHWFIQFYGIINSGGFDVIIGNPPYVEYTKIEASYRVIWGETLSTNNLFALVSERSRQLINRHGSIGLILPNSSVSAEKMKPLQRIFRQDASCWVSNFAWRPSKLFDGANMLLAIWVIRPSLTAACYSTRYHRWQADYREALFPTIQYVNATALVSEFRIPKLPGMVAVSIIEKCRKRAKGETLLHAVIGGAHRLYYFRAVLYWFKVLTKPPVMHEDGVQTPTGEMKELLFPNKVDRDAALAIMASNLFALNYTVWSSCQVVNSPDLMFPVSLKDLTTKYGDELSQITTRLIRDVEKRSEIQTRNYSARSRTFVMKKQYFYFKESKPIIDEIDVVLAAHYGFTAEELDFILNYDIKYRIGTSDDDGEEE